MPLTIGKSSDLTGPEATITVRNKETHGDTNEARALAQQYAGQNGFAIRGIANQPSWYPINEQGVASGECALGLEKIAAFEIEFRFVRL